MMPLYQVGLLGAVDKTLVAKVRKTLVNIVAPLGIANEISVTAPKVSYDPKDDYASVALFFGAEDLVVDESDLRALMRQGTPIVPVVGDLKSFRTLVPSCLHAINGIELSPADKELARPAVAALEVLGLLPRQRRIFLSYKRTQSSEVALQLFEFLSSKQFDVFLDTHGVPPGEDFQEVLWHRLSDSDVLVMLDTPTYFESRWTRLEYGRALAKSLAPLRLGWPGVRPSPRSMSGESLQFESVDFQSNGKLLKKPTLERVGLAVEKARSRGIAVRSSEINGAVIAAAQRIDGRFLALGPKRTIVIELYSGHRVLIYPSVGVPNAEHLYEACQLATSGDSRAVVFDDAGVGKRWEQYLEWLGSEVKSARLLRKARAAYDLVEIEGTG